VTLGGLATTGDRWACGARQGCWLPLGRTLIADWYLQQTDTANDADYYNLIAVHESGCGNEAGMPECLSPRRDLTGVPAGSEASSVLIQKF